MFLKTRKLIGPSLQINVVVMGNKMEKNSSHIALDDNALRFFDTGDHFKEVNIPLTRPLDIQLVPQFATTDTPGRTVRYKLLLQFRENRLDANTSDYLELSSSSSSDTGEENTSPFRVTVELTETVTKEGKKTTVGFARKTSIVKCNTWLGRASDIVVESKRIRLKGKLKQSKNDEKILTLLDFDLILCPSELIIPGTGDQWSLMGTLYANNTHERKDYKWRAAVPHPEVDRKLSQESLFTV